MIRPLAIVSAALGVALVLLVVGGWNMVQHDRDALFDRYAIERYQELRDVASDFAKDLSDIGKDLELAATLLDHAESPEVIERELRAIATIKREYLMIGTRDATGPARKVVALDAPGDISELANADLSQMIDRAGSSDRMLVSRGIGRNPPSSSYRIFARRSAAHHLTVGVVIDDRILLGRLKLQPGPQAVFAIFGPFGAPEPGSAVAFSAMALPEAFPVVHLDRSTARTLGLPDAPAVAVTLPIPVDRARPWRISVAYSTVALDDQEGRLVRRVLVGCGLVFALLVIAAAYIVHNARRAMFLRERLRNADRLAHLTERAEKIVDYIPSGVLTLSNDRRITGANQWFVQRAGTSCRGRALAELFADEETSGVVVDLVDRAVATRQPVSIHRARLSFFGQDAWMSIHAVPLERPLADVSALVVFDDDTPVRRIEEQLLHSEKLVTAGQLAAGIAHEIGTPLNVARGRVELTLSHLGAQHPDTGNQRVAIDQIDRVTRLIQQLLDYVHPVPMAMKLVDVASALASVRELLATRAAQRGVGMKIDTGSASLTVRANPDQLQQVLINLALNAIDACDRDGTVELRAVQRDHSVLLEVHDDGPGIAPEIRAQVFDPFFTTKKRGQGTGLGLWVVAQIVRAHTAEIELAGDPGEGTTVRLVWPATP